eukprot:scpid68982/ scgid7940/ 
MPTEAILGNVFVKSFFLRSYSLSQAVKSLNVARTTMARGYSQRVRSDTDCRRRETCFRQSPARTTRSTKLQGVERRAPAASAGQHLLQINGPSLKGSSRASNE